MAIAPQPRGFIATIERRPQAGFAAFVVLHLLVWTALPALLYPNLPLDLIEALTYGREWQLGYDKLPPLPWWLVEIVHRLIGIDAGYYLLAQAAVIAAFALVWMTAVPLVGSVGALIAVLILDGLHYFHYTAAKFNHDVIQLPLWALAGCAFHAGLRRGRMTDWGLLGLAIGLALWAKYFVVVLIVPLALFLLLDRDARKTLATPGPWIALAIALVVMAPHLLWLIRNDFLPLAYAAARAAPARSLADHLLNPAIFALSQFFFLMPVLLIAGALFWPRPKDAEQRAAATASSPLPNPPPQAGEGGRGLASTVASSRCWHSGRLQPRSRCRQPAGAAPSPSGAIRFGSFSDCGSSFMPAAGWPRGCPASRQHGRRCS